MSPVHYANSPDGSDSARPVFASRRARLGGAMRGPTLNQSRTRPGRRTRSGTRRKPAGASRRRLNTKFSW